MFKQVLANARFLAESGICIWFPFWGFRRKYELDEKFDFPAKVVRWSAVGVCYVLGSLPGPKFGPAKAVALVVGLSFLCWPNFAYRVRNLLKQERTPQDSQQ
jgi:hypothetical protein